MDNNKINEISILEDENIIDYMKRRLDTLHAEKLEDIQKIHKRDLKIIELEHKLRALQAACDIKDGIWDSIVTSQKPNQN